MANLTEYLLGKIARLAISFILAATVGTLFFSLKESPESVLVDIRPSMYFNLRIGKVSEYFNEFRELVPSLVESNSQFRLRLKNNFMDECSSGSVGFSIAASDHNGLWHYTIQRTQGQDSFVKAITCALNKTISEQEEIADFITISREETLPSALMKLKKTQIVNLVDHSKRLNTLNWIKAIVVGAIFGCIAYLALTILKKRLCP